MTWLAEEDSLTRRIQNLLVGESVSVAKKVGGLSDNQRTDELETLRNKLRKPCNRALGNYSIETGSFVTRKGETILTAVATRNL